MRRGTQRLRALSSVSCVFFLLRAWIFFSFLTSRDHAVLWLQRLHQGPVGVGHLRHQLPPAHALPRALHRLADLLQVQDRQADGHGLHFRDKGDRGGDLRRTRAKQQTRALLGLACKSHFLPLFCDSEY